MYLNEFVHEYERRGVPVIRYADDIVLLCRSQRVAERLLESSVRYLEGELRLKMNREKIHIAKLNATKNFKFLGSAFGKGKEGLFIRVHKKTLQEVKDKQREMTKRNRGRNVRKVMEAHRQKQERTITQSWKKEQAQLKRDREKMYEQYAPLQDELGQLLMVKHCAEIVMKGGQEQANQHVPVQATTLM